jgi:hypothetical protein
MWSLSLIRQQTSDGLLTKGTVAIDAPLGSQAPLSGMQVCVSSSYPTVLVDVERGAAFADGDIAIQEDWQETAFAPETQGGPSTVVAISFGAEQPLVSGPVAELTYQGGDPEPWLANCSPTTSALALDGGGVVPQDGDPPGPWLN